MNTDRMYVNRRNTINVPFTLHTLVKMADEKALLDSGGPVDKALPAILMAYWLDPMSPSTSRVTGFGQQQPLPLGIHALPYLP
jgi:hypothetical protein